jgi:hypothetical protein
MGWVDMRPGSTSVFCLQNFLRGEQISFQMGRVPDEPLIDRIDEANVGQAPACSFHPKRQKASPIQGRCVEWMADGG